VTDAIKPRLMCWEEFRNICREEGLINEAYLQKLWAALSESNDEATVVEEALRRTAIRIVAGTPALTYAKEVRSIVSDSPL